jgi:hypothetical protein
VKQLADVYRKVRNTARYLLGNLHDFDPRPQAEGGDGQGRQHVGARDRQEDDDGQGQADQPRHPVQPAVVEEGEPGLQPPFQPRVIQALVVPSLARSSPQ